MEIEKGKTYRDAKGNKVGPMEGGSYFFWQRGYGEGIDAEWSPEGQVKMPGPQGYGDLIAEWTDGPVRTVTRREVVAGSYGIVDVRMPHAEGREGKIGVKISASDRYVHAGPAELKAAAAVLLELAGALEE